MTSQQEFPAMEGAAFPWILEHLLAYPGTYEIPLRTMYTLNVNTQTSSHHKKTSSTSSHVPGNAFPRSQHSRSEDSQNMNTQTAAAQLRANLMQHITQSPSQPSSLPASFITTFVRKCFPPELDRVDFPQALTALDYLKDLEVRRRREVVAALDKLGIEREDIGQKEKIAKKYPGVIRWVIGTEEKERKVEALYTQVYIGLRRWTLINELSLTPFNKANCMAMLNTLYPPVTLQGSQWIQPTAQLTPQILSGQRSGFFRYITAVERNGATVLSSLTEQHRRHGETTGWPCLREALDNYLRMANNIIDECLEITGASSTSPTAASFGSIDSYDVSKENRIDSGVSFGSADSSKRNSDQSQQSRSSHQTRPSTSSSFSTHSRMHSRKTSKEKQSLNNPDDDNTTPKAAGSTLERIARELRKIKSRSNVRDQSRPATALPVRASDEEVTMQDSQQELTPTPSRGRSMSLKKSLKKMRSNGALRDHSTSRPGSRADGHMDEDMPAFDAEEMRRRREIWEAKERRKDYEAGLPA